MSERLKSIERIIGKQNRLKSIREKKLLDAGELKNLLFLEGNYERYIQPMYDFIDSNKHIFTHHNIQNQSRKELRKQSVKMMMSLLNYSQIDLINEPLKLNYTLWAMNMFDSGIVTKTFIHYFLYTKCLMLFKSNPKHQQFIADALSLKDLGCFGLTEFHHGSFSKEVQTLAIYDRATNQFVITTQGQKGMKYWIGAAAEIANMSVIWAQLIIDGKSYGPHPFIVQLRCKKTHKVSNGITIGDCGPKNGLNYIDNGFIILDGVRVPRQNLLGKLGSVDENGQYSSMIESSGTRFGFHMNPLSGGRGIITFTGNVSALKSATIALRYACSRKQFDNKEKLDQVLIIDYPLTKNRLIPLLVQTIVQIAPGLQLVNKYSQASNFGNLKYISQLHAISAAVKPRISWNSSSVAEQSRTILGGHGYSAFSNFSSTFNDSDVNNTWEGDNNMLLQQTSKYLMKIISKKEKNSILDLSFIWQARPLDQNKIQESLRTFQAVDDLLKDLLTQKYYNAKQVFEQLSKAYQDKNMIWLHFHPQAGNSLSLTYADFYIYSVTKQKIASSKSQKNKQFMFKCLLLWTFYLLEKERYGSIDFRKALQKEVVLLCEELLEPLVIATDLLIPSAHITGSVFANFEGQGLKDLIGLVYSSRETFRRISYYQQIVNQKNKK